MTISHTTAPINLLPPETIGEILSLVFPCRIELVERNPYPWNLALVCKFWRDVAFSTPHLWSTIIVHLDPLRRSRIDIRGDCLLAAWQLCLERCGDCPLNIWIDATSSETMLFVSSLLEPLMARVEQWRKMTFGFPFDILVPFVLDPRLRFPQLKELTLRGRQPSLTLEVEEPPQYELFPHAPVLSRIKFEEFSYTPGRLNFDWTRITDLTMFMTENSVDTVLYILEQTPHLSSFSFNKFLGPRASSSNDLRPRRQKPILEMKELRRLSWITYMFDSSAFFNSISAPQLEGIEFRIDDDHWNKENLQGCLMRSGCKIEKASLKVANSSTMVVEFLGIVGKDVKEVILTSTHLDEELMYGFGSGPVENWICPRMKRLVLVNCSMKEEGYLMFARMVELRLRGPSASRIDSYLQSLEEEDGSGSFERSTLESVRIVAYPDECKNQFGMDRPYGLLKGELLEEEMKKVTFEKMTTFGES
ncbi:hypothetical protein AN958_10039 [Leucoagaricus sp. SymC.cos]|nr:hypothetical protein AN958_10039 [Leucoagaricus sp. SymC.cos]